jgi:ribosomal protein S12 methylthiotransferase
VKNRTNKSSSYLNKSFCLITLGCPKNQVDSEVLAGQLSEQGINLLEEPGEADVILINTCGFIEQAKEESIQAILEALEYKKQPHKPEVYVWGCLSARYREEIGREIPEADGYFGIEAFEQIGRFFLGSAARFGSRILARRILTTPSHVAYLKIAEGCDHGCTFCAIPQFKGPFRSRSRSDLIREAKSLAGRGVKELILIAQDTTRYGTDRHGKPDLVGLLSHLVKIDGIEWIRVMYSHPNHVDDALIDTIGGEEKICNYLDMPLQHVAEPVLAAMGRGGNRKTLEQLIDRLRSRIPGLVLRTAFILGFPAESDSHFEELLSFIRDTRFERLGAFIYSREEGTAAYVLGNPVSRKIADLRYRRLMEIQKEISLQRNQNLEGTTTQVILDETSGDYFIGRTRGDCLDIDQTVWARGEARVGAIVNALIEEGEPYDLFGRIIPGESDDV